MTITTFSKKREEQLEEKVKGKIARGVLKENDSDLKALGIVSPYNNFYNLSMAHFTRADRPVEACDFMQRVYSFESENVAICTLYIYNDLAEKGLIELEDFEVFLDTCLRMYQSAEMLTALGEIYLSTFNDFQKALNIGRQLKIMYGDITLAKQVLGRLCEAAE